MRTRFALLPVVALCALALTAAHADEYTGSYSVTSKLYSFPAAVDSDVLVTTPTATKVEIKAQFYRPVNFTGIHPLVIMLHGNHSTCGHGSHPIVMDGCAYTTSGACNNGDTEIQSYLGYDYLATRLASWGFVVVSIDANRGITCGSGPTGDQMLNLSRGRLVLKHLVQLSQWNTNGGSVGQLGVDIKGHLDFSNVGLFGHSRGGEGVRAAYNQYRNWNKTWGGVSAAINWPAKILSPVKFQAIFEVGPVDGQSSPEVLNADSTAWNVILPMCDGDVSNLAGMMPFDRMLGINESTALPKSMFGVWGANHNFYNTQWQTSDSAGCAGPGNAPLWTSSDWQSTREQTTAIASVIPFFKAHLVVPGIGRQPSQGNVFNPLYTLPTAIKQIPTNVDRSYNVSPNSSWTMRLETFNSASDSVGSSGIAHTLSNVTISHNTLFEHQSVVPPAGFGSILNVARVMWAAANNSVFFQDNWTGSGSGITITNAYTLDFRVSRDLNANDGTPGNPPGSTDFVVQLVFPDDSFGPAVPVSQFMGIVGPIGSQVAYHFPLPTVRIPMYLLNPGRLTQARAVRFTFNRTTTGRLFFADINLSAVAANYNAKALLAQQNDVQDGHDGSTPFAHEVENPTAFAESLLAQQEAWQGRKAPPAKIQAQLLRVDPHPNPSTREPGGAYLNRQVTVHTSKGFPVRDAAPVLIARLHDGEERILGYGSPDSDGDTKKLVFDISSDDVSELPETFELEVGHHEDMRGQRWTMGRKTRRHLEPTGP